MLQEEAARVRVAGVEALAAEPRVVRKVAAVSAADAEAAIAKSAASVPKATWSKT